MDFRNTVVKLKITQHSENFLPKEPASFCASFLLLGFTLCAVVCRAHSVSDTVTLPCNYSDYYVILSGIRHTPHSRQQPPPPYHLCGMTGRHFKSGPPSVNRRRYIKLTANVCFERVSLLSEITGILFFEV